MTRTERAAYPRAIIRDRSSSRSGLDNSIRKNGAGGHNWGSIADERQLESGAMDDELAEENLPVQPTASSGSTPEELQRSNSGGLTDEELAKARKFRKNAFKKSGDNLDLAAIARTSAAVSGSPPSPGDNIARRPGQDNKQAPIASS